MEGGGQTREGARGGTEIRGRRRSEAGRRSVDHVNRNRWNDAMRKDRKRSRGNRK